MCNAVVEGKGGSQCRTLLFAEGCQVGIGQRVVCCVEVVIALCVLCLNGSVGVRED